MSSPTLPAAASVKISTSGGAGARSEDRVDSEVVLIGSFYSAHRGQSKLRPVFGTCVRSAGGRIARPGPRLSPMNQFPIYLGANGRFNGRVVNAAENPRFGPHLDAVAGFDIALDDAVQDNVRDDHRSLDASLLAHRQGAACFAFHIAVDVAVEMESADELDVAVDPGLRADQRVDFCFLIRFRFEHLPHLCPECRRSPRFQPTCPEPSTRTPAGNYDWRRGRCVSQCPPASVRSPWAARRARCIPEST